jgi:hypothetical protein
MMPQNQPVVDTAQLNVSEPGQFGESWRFLLVWNYLLLSFLPTLSGEFAV